MRSTRRRRSASRRLIVRARVAVTSAAVAGNAVAGGVWQLVPDAATWQKIEKAAPDGAKILVQLRDRDGISVYRLLVAPPKTAAAALTG